MPRRRAPNKRLYLVFNVFGTPVCIRRSTALFYLNAFIISTITMYLFWCAHVVTVFGVLVLSVSIVPASAYLLTVAYGNTRSVLQRAVVCTRLGFSLDDVVAKNKKVASVTDNQLNKYSVYYNEGLFFAFVFYTTFYSMKWLPPFYLCAIVVGGSSTILAGLSAIVLYISFIILYG